MARNIFLLNKLLISLFILTTLSIGFTDEAKSQQITFNPSDFIVYNN